MTIKNWLLLIGILVFFALAEGLTLYYQEDYWGVKDQCYRKVEGICVTN